jgi:RPGR ORF15 isoform (fragment)
LAINIRSVKGATMGIEGGSNSEVQNQEINQANNEQNEINQAEHQRSGEELEGNSTIDNEGERKQIEGKDDATESAEDESSQLDKEDNIEDDPNTEQPPESDNVAPEQQLDNQDTIESDPSGADEMGEDNNETVDSLDNDDEIEDAEDLDDNQDSTEGDIQDSLDAEDSIDSDDTDDSVEEDDNNEQDPLDSEDSIEDDGEEESESPEGEEETENPEGGEESETPEKETENPEDGEESESPEGEEETENPEESGESEGLEGKEDIENPEKDIDVEPTLDNKLDDIKDAAYEGRDAEGNMTPEAKEKLVDDMKQAYDDTPKEDRGDTLVPEKSEYLKDPPIAENKNTGERYNDVNYDWPSNGGFEGKPEEVTPQVGDRFDRVGAENGRYVAPIEGDTPQPVENRGLPYHFTEDNITDEPSYHSYEVDRDFGQLQDAINEYNNPALTAEENEFMRGEFQKEYDRNNWPSDEYTHEPGKTYYGDIAEAFDSGGGTQLELPMSVESLKELGMIHEV